MFEQGTVYRLGGGHYYFVISDPAADSEHIVVVNMTTLRGFSTEDASCVLNPGEHPVVQHASWIKYEKAEVVSLRLLNQRYNTSGQL